jgi:AcrR family transcriptional regulator
MHPTTQQAEKTREKILAAAKREFARKGYEGARTGSIAKEAGVNSALIHYYFKSKEGLYLELLRRLLGVDQAPIIYDFITNLESDLDPPTTLYLVIYMLILLHHLTTDSEVNRIIAREMADERERIQKIMRDYFIPRLGMLEELVRSGVEQGYFETSSPLLVVLSITSLIVTYSSNRDIFRGTEMYDSLYSEMGHEEFSNFCIEYTFKALTPVGKKVRIPQIDTGILQEATDLINEWKNSFILILQEEGEQT